MAFLQKLVVGNKVLALKDEKEAKSPNLEWVIIGFNSIGSLILELKEDPNVIRLAKSNECKKIA